MEKKTIAKIASVTAIAAALVSLFSQNAFAAAPTVYFDVQKENLYVGSEISVKILVNLPLPANAYDILVRYPRNILEPVRFDDSRSIIDIWQGQPTVFESGRIRINGGSVRAFEGERGEIITIYFKAAAAGNGSLSFENANIYLANGKGTKVAAEHKDISLTIGPAGDVLSGSVTSTLERDLMPPEITYFTLLQDPFNPNQKLLSFISKDRETGIKKNEIREKRWFFWSSWRNALNPAAIDNAVWAIDFRAVDNAGNAAERQVRAWDRFAKNLAPILVLMAIIPVLLYLFTKRKGG